MQQQKTQDAVNLSFQGFRAFPHEVNLSFQGFRAFPHEVMHIPGLQSLFVNDNQMGAIPESIGPLMTALTDLDLSNNEILRLPNTVGDLTSLTILKILRLPNTVGDLTSLTILKILRLPNTVGDLISLTILKVSGNLLKTIPPTMGRILALREMVVSNNPLEAPPMDVVQRGGLAVLQFLRSFHIGNRTGILRMNRMSLVSLPLEMAVTERITELDVSKNEIQVQLFR
ncbi:hypothetical protein T484DRAFT_1792181 [Baffinella frigidus]|nr:hypothetical protein T484DRAFT_1792181 [Cryptophyta sp. CCMP2293]